MDSDTDKRIIMVVEELKDAITGLDGMVSEREAITGITYMIAHMTIAKFDGDTQKAGAWLRRAFSDDTLSVLASTNRPHDA